MLWQKGRHSADTGLKNIEVPTAFAQLTSPNSVVCVRAHGLHRCAPQVYISTPAGGGVSHRAWNGTFSVQGGGKLFLSSVTVSDHQVTIVRIIACAS